MTVVLTDYKHAE
jgi:serine/threonine-protein kinase SRPK3